MVASATGSIAENREVVSEQQAQTTTQTHAHTLENYAFMCVCVFYRVVVTEYNMIVLALRLPLCAEERSVANYVFFILSV